MAHLLVEESSTIKSIQKGKRIKCKVHIIMTSTDNKMTSIGTILVPIENNLKFCQLVVAAQQRISKNKKYNQFALDYNPNTLEIFIREKTEHNLSIDQWSEVDWDDIISDLFNPSHEVIVFKFNDKKSVNDPNDGKDNIICRVFIRYNKQQQDEMKASEYEKLGNDFDVKIFKENNDFLGLLSEVKTMINKAFGKVYDESFIQKYLSIYTTTMDEAVVNQITNWGEMEINDELDLIDDDEIVVIVMEMQYLKNNNRDNDNNNQLDMGPALKQMKTYLMMDNNKSPTVNIKVRFWNKQNEVCQTESKFDRNITVKQFKQQMSRISGLPHRSDLTPSIEPTPSHSCICNQVINQPTENGMINFFYVPFGSPKGCSLTHIKLECDFNITIEQLRQEIMKETSLNLGNMRIFGGTKNITFIKKAKLSDLGFSKNASNVVYCCNDEKTHSHNIAVEIEKCQLGFRKNNGDTSFENVTAIKSPNASNNTIVIVAKSADSITFIKSLIEQKLKIPVEKQLIFYQTTKGDVQHIGNDYHLRDIGLREKLRLIVSSWNKPINLAFDLFNHSHQLFDNSLTKLFEVFNFNETDDILFVSPRYIFHKEAFLETFGKDDARTYLGNVNDGTIKSALRLTSSWMPFITQTRTGMSSFLSCLYLLSQSEVLSQNTGNKDKLLGHLRELAPTFSPFIHSMKILLDGNANQLTPAHKSALSNGCYKLFREILPVSSIPNEKVFEFSHYIFWYLLRFVSDKFAKTESFKEETLTCPLSSAYLVNPVLIPNDDKIYSYQSIVDRINGGKLFNINDKKFAKLTAQDITIDYDTLLLLKVYPHCQTVSNWNWMDLTKSVRKQIDHFELKDDEFSMNNNDDDDDEKDNKISDIQQKLALTWRQITKFIYDTSNEVCTDCQKKDKKPLSCIKCKKLNERKMLSECMAMKPIEEHDHAKAALCYDTNDNICVITKRSQQMAFMANEGSMTAYFE